MKIIFVNTNPLIIRQIFTYALKINTAGMIFVSNEPVQYTIPGDDQIKIIREIAESAEILNIKLYDFIVYNKGRYISFKQYGLL